MGAKAIFKWNSGRLALICSKCRVIIKEGNQMTETEFKALKGEINLPSQYCEEHNGLSILNGKPSGMKKAPRRTTLPPILHANNSSDKVISEIQNYLNQFDLRKIELVLEAISLNFQVVTNKYGEVTTKDWENSFEIYQNINKLIAENLFDVSDSRGFPKAKIFLAIYMDEKPNSTIGEITTYFLHKRLNSLSTMITGV